MCGGDRNQLVSSSLSVGFLLKLLAQCRASSVAMSSGLVAYVLSFRCIAPMEMQLPGRQQSLECCEDILLLDGLVIVVVCVGGALYLLDLLGDVVPGKGDRMVHEEVKAVGVAYVRVVDVDKVPYVWVFRRFPLHLSQLVVLGSPDEAEGGAQFVFVCGRVRENVFLCHVPGDGLHGSFSKYEAP